MSTFLKAVAAALLAVLLGMAVSKEWKEAAMLLSLVSCCMILSAAVGYLSPVLELIRQLRQQGDLDGELIRVLTKIAGIGILSEIASTVCADAGSAGLGKAVQLLASCVILWLSVPLLTELLSLAVQLLGGV